MPTNDNTSRGRRPDTATLSRALSKGEPREIATLVALGADLHYRRESGYDALLDAVHGRDIVRDGRLMELLQFLVSHKVDLNGMSLHGETALRVLSHRGRFDAVRLLLDAGADESQLGWTPLIRAAAIGHLRDVRHLLDNGAALEDRDFWSRTAWLVAVQAGDLDKAALLAERGADLGAVGRCRQPANFLAIRSCHPGMLRWLLDLGCDVEQTDQFGATALHEAAEADCDEAVDLLLGAGAQVDREHNGSTALGAARNRGMVVRLLDAGADPRHIGPGGRRTLVGLPADPDPTCLDRVTEAHFHQAPTRRFGSTNPEPMDHPFWHAMIRAGISGYQAAERFNGRSKAMTEPVWTAERFGQSLTLLPDGRVVQIGGEHEDYYDPDFCIYNDVFVHEPDGTFRIYGYPQSVFPPTDFHTATLVDDWIYIIGSIGYHGRRAYGRTPVHRLDTRTWRMERLDPGGTCPGWIHAHRATRTGLHEIKVTGGEVLTREDGEEHSSPNVGSFVLDTGRLVWRTESAARSVSGGSSLP